MKRRFLVGIATTAVAAMVLTGCGKTPTLEDIRDNMGKGTPTTATIEGSVSFDVEAEIDDISDDLEMLLDYLEESEGIDLTDGIDANIEVSVKADMEKSGDITHATGSANIEYDTNIDELNDALDDELDGLTEATFESYIDADEEVEYNYEYEEDEWYVSDYEEDDDEDGEIYDALNTFFDLAIDYNESADKSEQIKVEKSGNEYVVAWNFTFDNEFAENIDKKQKKDIQKAFDELEMDIELDDILEIFDTVGEYVNIEVPIALEMRFVQEGKGKNVEYLISGMKLDISGSVSCDFDEDEVADLLEEAGAPTDGMDISCSFSGSASVSVSLSLTAGYKDIDEIEIPKKVVKNAIEY